jgi:outer membrane lipoprotein-sorting protein
MPDQKLGLVLLSNVTSSSLGNFVMETVWSNLVGRGSTPPAQQTDSGPAVDPQKEVGTYQIVEAGVNIEVSMKDGKLLLTAPSQPPYPMQNLGGRRYKLGEPAPQGFFATFRPIKGNETQSEMYLEQPQGNLVLPKIVGDAVSAASAKTNSEYSGPLKEMLGSYEHEQGKIVVEITVRDGKVALVVPGQPPYPLAQKEKDKLNSPSLPGTYWVDVKRDAEGKVSGIMVNQPEGQFALRRLPDTAVEVSVDELIPKMTVAAGGKENLLKHKSSTATIEVDYESQGLTGEGVVNAKAPSSLATRVTLMALGKKIGSVVNYFDGNSGGQTTSFTPEEIYTGKRLEDVKRAADFYSPLNWKKNFKTITIKRKASVGGEEVYVVEKAPEKGNNVTDYVSTKSFLLLKRDTIISNDTANVELPQTVTYSDYRLVDGVMVPYKAAINDAAIGDILIRVKEVKFNVEIPDSVFQKPPK